MASSDDFTRTLNALEEQQSNNVDALIEAVYAELHEQAEKMLRRESPADRMQPTALVHEAYLRLVDQDQVNWHGETHFRAIAATAMHRVLVDRARRSKREKRGGKWRKVTLDDADLSVDKPATDILVLHEALERLRVIDPQQFQIVQLRIFGGLTMEQIADVTKLSIRTAEREWAMAKMWLRREISKEILDDR